MDVSIPDVEVVVKVKPEETVSVPDCENPETIIETEVSVVLEGKYESSSSEEPLDTVPERLPILTLPNKAVPADEPTTFQHVCENLVLR